MVELYCKVTIGYNPNCTALGAALVLGAGCHHGQCEVAESVLSGAHSGVSLSSITTQPAREIRPDPMRAPGVITRTQPKVPEAEVRGSQEVFQWVLVSPKRVPGVRKGVQRGPVGPPGPAEVAALCFQRGWLIFSRLYGCCMVVVWWLYGVTKD